MATKGFFKRIPRDLSPIARANRLLDRLNAGETVRIPEDITVEQKSDTTVVTVRCKTKDFVAGASNIRSWDEL